MCRCAAILMLGTGALGCTESHPSVDAGDAGQPEEAAVDAGPGGPPGPELVWASEGRGMCPELNVPTYEGRSLGAARGSVRWTVPTRPVTTSILVGPTYVSNASLWSVDLWSLDLIDHDLGDEEWNAYHDPLAIAPSMFENGTVWRYQHAPMSLGANMAVSRDAFGLFYLDFTRTGGARRWSFPELESMVDRVESLPGENLSLQHVMPAWSPRTGQIAYPVGYDHSLIAVSCPVDDGGQFILHHEIEGVRYPLTRVYYRANGELLLHRGLALYVISPQGETLRSAPRPRDAEPYAYQEGCGILYQEASRYYWLDVDTMTSGHVFEMSATPDLMALPDCRLLANGIALGADGSEHGIGGRGDAIVPLADGTFAVLNGESGLLLVSATGAALEGPTALGATPIGTGPYITPDGHAMFRARDRTAFFALNLPPLGPMLWPEAGMNWAHTNSPLPAAP